MAVTQIHPIQTTLVKAIDYISNPDKTDGTLLIYGYNCTPEMAAYEFEMTKLSADRQGGVLAHHLIQSFKPGEVDYNTAHEIGRRLADQHLGGKYEYVIATHIDRDHIHNHIIFNSVPIIRETKYQSNTKSYMSIRKLSDELCAEYNLSVVVPENDKAKTYKEHYADERGVSWKSALREAIDRCIIKARDWEDFLALMQAEDYEIKRGKHIAFRANGQEKFTRAKTIGARYTEANIKAQLSGVVKTAAVPATENTPTEKPRKENTGISLLIDIENNIKAKQSAGYSEWAKKHNLKMAAMTMNYISDNGLLDYSALTEKYDSLKNSRNSALARIKEIEKRIKQLDEQIEDLDVFRKTKPVVQKLESVVFKDKYRREYDTDFILHNAAKQALKIHFPDGKHPLIKTLRAEIKELYDEKNKLYPEYYQAKDELQSLSTIKKNVDSILGQPPEQEREREKEREARNKNKDEYIL